MKVLIIDPVGGISGDMLLAGLIHMGCPTEYLGSVFAMLELQGYSLEMSRRRVEGIEALGLTFNCAHSHETRTYRVIRDEILSLLPGPIRARAERIFHVLARAEAEVHGVRMDEVHFHEVGALDSILDIVGISAAVEYWRTERIYCRAIPLGTGMTKSMHGTIPLPAPATVRLLEGRKVKFTDIALELTTPTGAAVVAALAELAPVPSDLVVRAVGYGCGTREVPGRPNICRTILCESLSDDPDTAAYIVEADIDDMSPEETEFSLARLTEAGARDAMITPKIMKRGRPGFCIQAICTSDRLEDVITAMLVHTTSIGARYYPVERRVLPRTGSRVGTSLGEVGVKKSVLPDGSMRIKPEYRDMSGLAEKRGIPMNAVRAAVEKALRDAKEPDENE